VLTFLLRRYAQFTPLRSLRATTSHWAKSAFDSRKIPCLSASFFDRIPAPSSTAHDTTSTMAFALSASTSKFVGAKVAAKPAVARRQARCAPSRQSASGKNIIFVFCF